MFEKPYERSYDREMALRRSIEEEKKEKETEARYDALEREGVVLYKAKVRTTEGGYTLTFLTCRLDDKNNLTFDFPNGNTAVFNSWLNVFVEKRGSHG